VLTEPARAGPVEVTWEITRDCNLNCGPCYSNCSRDRSLLGFDLEEARRLLRQFVESKTVFLFLDGGEPLSFPGIVPLLEEAANDLCVFLSTNGTLVSDEMAAVLARTVGATFVTLQGHTRSLHESTTSTRGSFDATVEGIKRLAARGVWTSTVLRLTNEALPFLGDYVRFAEDLGVSKVTLLHPYDVGAARDHYADRAPSIERTREAIAKLLESKPTAIPIGHPYYPHCHDCCTQFCTVLWNGDVTTCTYLRERFLFGNVRERKLVDIWLSNEFSAFRNHERRGKCRSCPDFSNCGGGCRAIAAQHGLSPFDSDPTCWREQANMELGTPCNLDRAPLLAPTTRLRRVTPATLRHVEEWDRTFVYLPMSRRVATMNELGLIIWEAIDGTIRLTDVAHVAVEAMADSDEAALRLEESVYRFGADLVTGGFAEVCL